MNNLITAFEGQLATNPEYSETSDGTPLCTAVVLINRSVHNEAGEWDPAEPTRRHIKATEANAKRLAQLDQDSTVVIIGTVETDAWSDPFTHQKITREHVIVDSIGQGLMLPRPFTGEHITLDPSRPLTSEPRLRRPSTSTARDGLSR